MNLVSGRFRIVQYGNNVISTAWHRLVVSSSRTKMESSTTRPKNGQVRSEPMQTVAAICHLACFRKLHRNKQPNWYEYQGHGRRQVQLTDRSNSPRLTPEESWEKWMVRSEIYLIVLVRILSLNFMFGMTIWSQHQRLYVPSYYSDLNARLPGGKQQTRYAFGSGRAGQNLLVNRHRILIQSVEGKYVINVRLWNNIFTPTYLTSNFRANQLNFLTMHKPLIIEFDIINKYAVETHFPIHPILKQLPTKVPSTGSSRLFVLTTDR